MTEELYKVYRPNKLDEMIGQESAINALQSLFDDDKIPHCLLFAGPSGCGKTTLARITKQHLGVGDADFVEMNAADETGIDSVRKIRSRMGLKAIAGDTRAWLIDEVHMLSSSAQNGILKLLEDTPNHVYFMLATTNPNKLLPTIRTRSTEITLRGMTQKEQKKLLDSICKREEIEIGEEVRDQIIIYSEGSARKALVLLDQVYRIDDEEEQLEALRSTDNRRQAIELARALMSPKKPRWNEIIAIIKEINEDPESLRRMILGYSSSVMLGSKTPNGRCYRVIDAFRDNFFDSGRAGLIAACWEVVMGDADE